MFASASLSLSDQILKRGLDLVLVLGTLPVLLPFMMLVAIVIRIDSRGPVFFRQLRVGLGNRVFHIYKFRSMVVAQHNVTGSQSTSRNDSRITVTPRPHPLGSKAEDRLFWNIDGPYWHRHAVKPGMTGLAQICGFCDETQKEADLTNRLQADLKYV